MERLPEEIVGEILSHVPDPRDVLSASAACRKWRRVFREHLRSLSFLGDGLYGLPDREALMSRTILQTTRLQSLIIHLDYEELSDEGVTSWLRHTRRSLKELVFDVDGKRFPLNAVAICGCGKLEKLTVGNGDIDGLDPNAHRFPSLRSLTLVRCLEISDAEVRALLAASPRLESLELTELTEYSPVESLTVAAPPSLRSFCVEHAELVSLVFESDRVEHLHLQSARLQTFTFIGNGTLTNLTIARTDAPDLEIRDSAASLERLDIVEAEIAQSELHGLISKSSKLRELRLWDVSYENWSKATGLATAATDLERVASSCPQLRLLILGCDLLQQDDHTLFPYSLGGSTRFKNMVYLKVGMSGYPEEEEVSDKFFNLVEGLLDRCPSLKKLVISGLNDDLKDGPRLSTRISRIRRKCAHSNVQLGFAKSFSSTYRTQKEILGHL